MGTRDSFPRVLEAQHENRKQLTADLRRQQSQTPREEAVISQAATTPVRAIRN